MADPKSPIYSRNQDRRSAFNRRWIKADYNGKERRSGNDRREELLLKDLPVRDRREELLTKDLPVPEDFDSKKRTGLEKLLVSNAIQLEALTQILLDKGYVKEEELIDMMNKIQVEYQGKK